MQKLGESEKASIRFEGGKHLKNILSEFCKRNNVPYPQIVLPQKDGAKITITKEKVHKEYLGCNKLVLSWDGENSAILEKIPYNNSHSKVSPRTIIQVPKTEYTTTTMYPLDKPLKCFFEIGLTYILKGSVNGKEISLEARTSSLTTNEIPLGGNIKFKYHNKQTKRLDDNKEYWFLANLN